MWLASFGGRSAYLRDAKGLHDLAALLARPGVDVPALELAGAEAVAAVAGRPGTRARPRGADKLQATPGRPRRTARVRAAPPAKPTARNASTLLAELRRATRPGGASRAIAPTAAERARKAVTARIRDAIRRIQEVLPELGTHLDRSVRTGATCRYDPDRR